MDVCVHGHKAAPPSSSTEQNAPPGTCSDCKHQQHQLDLDSIFTLLEENIMSLVKKELKKIQWVLSPDYCETTESLRDDEEQRSNTKALLKIIMNLLKKMNQEDLADLLQTKNRSAAGQRKHKSNMKKKFHCLFEGNTKAGNQIFLNEIYTRLYTTGWGETRETDEEHEVRQIEAASRKQVRPETAIRREDIFEVFAGKNQSVRTVMMKGVAGIGKTTFTQRFTLDWAENRADQDIHFTFPFTFRELNLLKDKTCSLVDLIHHFFTETKKAGICRFADYQVLFILDGLDECRLPLDFHKTKVLTDATAYTSVDTLLINLIRGKLLPQARLWITTRPAAANRIPPEFVDTVTEIRGFTDAQKEDYFRRRFTVKEQANRIISHIQTSRDIYVMCHLPVFCWIAATVLEDVLDTRKHREPPKTLTEMYIHFVVIQSKLKLLRCDSGDESNARWSPDGRRIITSLGKLAFEQMQTENLIFYEADLKDCGVDMEAAGVLTHIFEEERCQHQDKIFSFVHLSVQEFLAALHVHQTFIKSDLNLLSEETSAPPLHSVLRRKGQLVSLHQNAIDKALQSPSGELDLFLRFLLGISTETNQVLLQGLSPPSGSGSETSHKTVQYIKKKISDNLAPERSIVLFHCLTELQNSSLVEEVQHFLTPEGLPEKLSPIQWSALVFILLSSGKDLDVFDLNEYSGSEEALLRLLPVVRVSNRSLLSSCDLSDRSCVALSSILSSQSSCLRHLDLRDNHLRDSGLKLLSTGLSSPHCQLESLSLSGCAITREGCVYLVSALSSNPSHLRELDLSYNHLEDSGKKLLSALLQDPGYRLEALRMDHGGEQRLKPGLRKYSCEVELDMNTVNKNLKVSDNNRKATLLMEEQPYPRHPDRFDVCPQVLCRNGLAGRSYWEVEWRGRVFISVSYREIDRTGDGSDTLFGSNDQSWSLSCSDDEGYRVCHNYTESSISSWSMSHRVAVYVDCPAGTLSFYSVSSHSLIHLHTFRTTFTRPLYPGFRLWAGSVTLWSWTVA